MRDKLAAWKYSDYRGYLYDCLVFLNAVQSANRQLWVVVNYLLTIVGAFTFGYFVGHFASFDIPGVS